MPAGRRALRRIAESIEGMKPVAGIGKYPAMAEGRENPRRYRSWG